MIRHCRLSSLLILLALALPASAGVYKYYDENGNLVLSDSVPRQGAEHVEKLTPQPVMTVPAFKPGKASQKSSAAPAKAAQPAAAGDYVIVIQSPAEDQHYPRAGEAIPVAFSIDPSLRAGHQLQVFLDGQHHEGLDEISPQDLGRGSHTIEIRVADAAGKTLKSSSVTFHVRQPSTLSPLRKPKPQPAPDKK